MFHKQQDNNKNAKGERFCPPFNHQRMQLSCEHNAKIVVFCENAVCGF